MICFYFRKDVNFIRNIAIQKIFHGLISVPFLCWNLPSNQALGVVFFGGLGFLTGVFAFQACRKVFKDSIQKKKK